MGSETELKFKIPDRLRRPSHWDVPGANIGASPRSDLLTTYFDTKKHKLERHGLSLRVRRNGANFVQAVKRQLPPHQLVAANGKWKSKASHPILRRQKTRPCSS